MKEFLEMYKKLNKEQRDKIFNEEQKSCLDGLLFYERLFEDKKFYEVVKNAVLTEAYNEINHI